MSDKPREWWIPDHVNINYAHAYVAEMPGAIRVIEYSAYESAIRERDELQANEFKMNGALSAMREQLNGAIEERDEARADHHDANEYVDQLSAQLAAERAKSAKLVEAIADAKRELRKGALLNEAGKRAFDILYDASEGINQYATDTPTKSIKPKFDYGAMDAELYRYFGYPASHEILMVAKHICKWQVAQIVSAIKSEE